MNDKINKLISLLEDLNEKISSGHPAYSKDSEEYKILQDWLAMEQHKFERYEAFKKAVAETQARAEAEALKPKPFVMSDWLET